MKKLLTITLTVAMLLLIVSLNTLTATAQTEELSSSEFYTVDGDIVSIDGADYERTVVIIGSEDSEYTVYALENVIELGLDKQPNIKVIYIDGYKNPKEEVAQMAEKYASSNIAFCYDTTDKTYNMVMLELEKTGMRHMIFPIIFFIEQGGKVSNVTTDLISKEFLYHYATGSFPSDGLISFNVVGEEDYDYAYEVLERMNQLRKSLGLNELKMDKTLLEGAMQRAAEIGINFTHTRPDGSGCTQVLPDDYTSASNWMGENIALNQSTPEIVVEAWAGSAIHYSNMTNTRYSSVGVGCYVMSDGTRGWVQIFSSAEAAEVQKSGKITAEHKIDAKLKYLNLRLSAQDDIHNLNKGEKGVLKVVNHNKGWDRSRQIMDSSLFEFAGFDDSIATVSPDGVVEATGEGLLKITATLKQYPELVVEYWQQIGHVYENDCDRFCSVCYEKREITHTYDNSCDTICNICGEVRSIKHTYDNACDTTCNVCDEVRSITHCYYNACDKDCNVCGQIREVPDHIYSGICDEDCNECGEIRTAPDHVYDYPCDKVCNVCGKDKGYAIHYYEWIIEKEATCVEDGLKHLKCENCGKVYEENVVIPATGIHTYDNSCDTTCNVCDEVRSITHRYYNACDKDCNVCGQIRTVPDHVYDAVCDEKCNICKEVRIAADHVYDYPCDPDCNVCGNRKSVYGHSCKWIIDKKATCLEDGLKHLECNYCGTAFDENTVIPARGYHIYSNDCDADCMMCGEIRTVPDHVYDAVCDTDCNVCGYTRKAAAHTYDNDCDIYCNVCGKDKGYEIHSNNWVIDKAATCVADGLEHLECRYCGKVSRENTVIPATGVHEYNNACDATCNTCEYIRTIPGHTYSNDCDNICNLCGKVRTITHQYEWVVNRKPTCGANGYKYERCSVCDSIRNIDTIVNPTGEHTYYNACDTTCNVCKQIREVPNHVYDAVCDNECNVCGKYRSVPAHVYDYDCDDTCNLCGDKRSILYHAYVYITDKEPTCAEAGLRHSECKYCGKVLDDNVVIQATGKHTYDNSCDTTCNVCNAVRTVIHQYKWVTDKTATCGENGVKHLECKYCGEKDGEYAEIPLTGKHTYDNACDTKCNVCGKTRSTTHIYKWVIDKKVTCYENGIKHEECVECGDKRNTNTIVKAYGGHVYSHIADKYCDLCGEECEVTGKHLIKEDGIWYYYVDGEKSDDTTLVKYNGIWYYVKNGVKNNATTLVKYKGTWYYVKNGKKNNSTTLVKYNGVWYYVKGGKKNNSTTLCKYNGTWYYVKNGKKSTATTLCKYGGKYYYVKSGKKNTATTIVKYNGKKYYVKKGIAQTSFSGKVKINGKTYTVKKGVIK